MNRYPFLTGRSPASKQKYGQKRGREMTRRNRLLAGLAAVLLAAIGTAGTSGMARSAETNGIVVYQTDFGLKDGAVSAMKGVAVSVDPNLRLEDLTHEIPAFNIWEGAYRLNTTVPYWPAGTVFVSVIDPGVGTDRRSVVLQTKSGHFIVTPDNGTLTLVSKSLGVAGLREIDEESNRLPGSERSYTFHGRDIYSHTAARLASGKIAFEQVGPALEPTVVALDYQEPSFSEDAVAGTIPILDVQFGNVWTNIDRATFKKLDAPIGTPLMVKIYNEDALVFEGSIPYVNTFGDVPQGHPLIYFNSVDKLSFALNWDNFAATYKVASGPGWRVEVTR